MLSSCVMQATDNGILEVGHRVSKCLRAAGLSVEWDEDAHETILIKVWLVCEQFSCFAGLCYARLIRCTSCNISHVCTVHLSHVYLLGATSLCLAWVCLVAVLGSEDQRLGLLHICGGS